MFAQRGVGKCEEEPEWWWELGPGMSYSELMVRVEEMTAMPTDTTYIPILSYVWHFQNLQLGLLNYPYLGLRDILAKHLPVVQHIKLFSSVPASECQDRLPATRVVREKVVQLIYSTVNYNPAIAFLVVLRNLLECELFRHEFGSI